ncbi:hypothetical protein JB92DRAFT_2934727 [Gautieria morchelliformis]|nr:hypothetical protein JB92DRAFT_2934727 [Gautieria morchelliformis]
MKFITSSPMSGFGPPWSETPFVSDLPSHDHMVQGPSYIVDEGAYESPSNHPVTNTYHDGGNVWNTTHISPAGTAALAQSDGSPRRHPARQTRVSSAAPRRRTRFDLLDPIALIVADGICTYVSPQGVVCSKTPTRYRDIAKHWLTHVMWEMEEIERGRLEMSQAAIINTEARRVVAHKFGKRCPRLLCTHSTYYVRPEALAAHLKTCRAGLDLPPPSYEVANQMARERMREIVRYDPQVFGNGYDGAVWSILHAS